MKILPTGKFYYMDSPITKRVDGNEVYLDGVIEVSEDHIVGILNGTHCFTDDLTAVRECTETEIAELRAQTAQAEAHALEAQHKALRAHYMDAYRKYQAAVNYGEFAPAPAVDPFIAALRAKDWTALENVPSALKYFIGEVGLAESGLELTGNQTN